MRRFIIMVFAIIVALEVDAGPVSQGRKKRWTFWDWCGCGPTVPPPPPESCKNIPLSTAKSTNETGGVFDVNIPGLGVTELYCDVRTDGGDWIVFQRRMDGSVDFDRNWNAYVNGFGSVNKEFWLGLEALYHLTKSGSYEMRVDMIDQNTGKHYYAKYSSFKVESAVNKYRLRISGYSGNATDSLANPPHQGGIHNNMAFTTKDQDNDKNPGTANCAKMYPGGWWFNRCYYSHLNRIYGTVQWNQGAVKRIFAKFVEMKLREKI